MSKKSVSHSVKLRRGIPIQRASSEWMIDGWGGCDEENTSHIPFAVIEIARDKLFDLHNVLRMEN